MKERFEKYSRNNVLLSILMVILGLLLIFWPGKTLELVATTLGVGLLAGAVVSAVNWYRGRHVSGGDYATLAIAIVCLIGGLVVLIAPKGILSLLPKLIGVAVLLNGILNLAQALDMRKKGGDWVSPVVMAALTVAAGLFLIFFSFSVMKVAVMVIGGVIAYNGISNLLIEAKYRKAG